MSAPGTTRRTFGPIVLAGLVAGALGAMAGSNPWFVAPTGGGGGDPVPGIDVTDPVVAAGEMPLALALNLVLLAVWGVVLVTRGWLRRGVAGLGMLAAGGLVATVVVGFMTLGERVDDAIRERPFADVLSTESPWFWVAALTALVSLVTTALAVAWAPTWPEMGRRYDAPGAGGSAPPAAVPPEERDNLDLWKSMDQGDDPTA